MRNPTLRMTMALLVAAPVCRAESDHASGRPLPPRTSLLAPDAYDRVLTPGPTPTLGSTSRVVAPQTPVVPKVSAPTMSGMHAHPPSTPPPVTSSVAPQETITYTCPMHPEVQSAKPDDCPKCGMRLVPRQGPK